MRISDWSSDVCSSDLIEIPIGVSVDPFFEPGRGRVHLFNQPPPDATWARGVDVDGVAAPSDGVGRGVFGAIGAAFCCGRVMADGEIGRASCRERVCQYV